MATDGSNIVVALYSEPSQTMGTVAFQTNSFEVSGSTSKPCAGAPYVAYGATNFLTVWLEGGTNYVDLHGQFLGQSGSIILAGLPRVDLKGLSWNGQSFLVLWTLASNGLSSVQGQLLNASGLADGPPIMISSAGANATECAVAGATNHLVVWMESTGNTNEWHTRSRAVDTAGALSDIITISSLPATSAHPVAIAVGREGALAVWNRQTGPYAYQDCCGSTCTLATNYWLMLYGRIVNLDGSVKSTEFQISNMVGNQTDPKTAFNGTNFLVIWRDSRFGLNRCSPRLDPDSTYCQQLDSDGTLIDIEFAMVPSYAARPEAMIGVREQFVCVLDQRYAIGTPQMSHYWLVNRVRTADLGVMGFHNFVPAINGFNQVEFTGSVSKGYYYLQISTDLRNWAPICRFGYDPCFLFALPPNATSVWEDPPSTPSGQRFYRAVNQLDVCVSNLTLLDHVKAVWLFEQAKHESDMPVDSELFGPGRYLPSKPVCPGGGTYELHYPSDKPWCTLGAMGHTLY